MSFLVLFFCVSFFSIFDYFYSLLFMAVSISFLLFLQGDVFMGGGFMDSLSSPLIFLSLAVFFYCFLSSFLDFWTSNVFGGFSGFLGGMYFLLMVSFICFNFITFYISFEFLFLLMYMFLLSWGYSPERLQASVYMIFYTVVVSFPFLVYSVIAGDVALSYFTVFSGVSFYWWGFFVLVFLVKLPVYGAHLWLPKAHVEAPVSGSMLLAGVLLKLGGYGLIRFSFFILPEIYAVKGYLMSLGLLGGTFGCFLCLRQSDLKAFVAYSSVCHLGFSLGGLYSGSFVGYTGGLWMLIAHGFCSSCLFYILYVFYERFHSRSLVILKGLGVSLPIMGMVWFFFSMVNMGVPPFFSFLSEIFILTGMSSTNFWSFFFSGLFLLFAGFYGIYLFLICFHGQGHSEGLALLPSAREQVNFYSHFFFLFFFLFCLFFFF